MDTAKLCPVCDDTGWKTIGAGRDRRVTRCDCRRQLFVKSGLGSAGIPKRYECSELSNFEIEFDRKFDAALSRAKFAAGRFVEEYPTDNKGLLLVGQVGVGKTHVVIGIIKELIRSKGVRCLYCDYVELLRAIQNSYNSHVQASELEVLKPIFEVEVLALANVGALLPTAWVRDTVAFIFKKRYDDNKTTLLTTYLPDLPARTDSCEPQRTAVTKNQRAVEEAREVMRERPLGERIGNPVLERIHETCRVVQIDTVPYHSRTAQR